MKKGFTLAEVLITLGIIGIVAAMTMPSLIAENRKKQTVTLLKQAYSILSQAIILSETSSGSKEFWDYSLSGEDFYKTYIKPYVKTVNEYYGMENPLEITYKRLSGTDITTLAYYDKLTPKVVLSNGTVAAFANNGSGYIFYIDINGKRLPNRYGIDLFALSVSDKKGIVPFGYNTSGSSEESSFFWGSDNPDRNVLTGTNPNACSSKSSGAWCTALIIYDNWEIKNDYPWR